MFCRNCGQLIHDGDSFCVHCGTPVRREEPEESTIATESSEIANSAVQTEVDDPAAAVASADVAVETTTDDAAEIAVAADDHVPQEADASYASDETTVEEQTEADAAVETATDDAAALQTSQIVDLAKNPFGQDQLAVEDTNTGELYDGAVPVYEQAPPKKSRKKLLIGGIVAGVLVLAAVLTGVFLLLNQPKDYYLVKFISGGEDLIDDFCLSDVSIPCQLHIEKQGEAVINFSDGEAFAKLTYDEEAKTGSIMPVGSNTSSDVAVKVDDDSFQITQDENQIEMIFTITDREYLKNLSGSYSLTGLSSEKGEDEERFDALTLNGYSFISKLTVEEDGKCSGVAYEGSNTMEFTLNPKDRTISGTSEDNGSSIEGYFTAYGDTVTVYNTSGKFCFYFKTAKAVDHSAFEGEYVLTDMEDKDHAELEAFRLDNYKFPSKLKINSDGTGIVDYADGTNYIEFKLNEGETAGIYHVASDNGEKDYHLFLWKQKDAVSVYLSGNLILRYKPASDSMDSLVGNYPVTKWTNVKEKNDYLEDWALENKMIANRLTVKSDGTGVIYHSDDSVNAILKINAKDMICDWENTADDKKARFYVVKNGDELTLYGIDNGDILKATVDPYKEIEAFIGSEDSITGKLITYKTKDNKSNQADKHSDWTLELYPKDDTSFLRQDGNTRYLHYQEDMTGTMTVPNSSTNTKTNTDSYSSTSSTASIIKKVLENLKKPQKKNKVFLTFDDGVLTIYEEDACKVYQFKFDKQEQKEESE